MLFTSNHYVNFDLVWTKLGMDVHIMHMILKNIKIEIVQQATYLAWSRHMYHSIFRPSFLRSSITLELLDLLLTLFEGRYLLGSFFVPVPVILIISNWAPCWAPRQIQDCKKRAPPNTVKACICISKMLWWIPLYVKLKTKSSISCRIMPWKKKEGEKRKKEEKKKKKKKM